MMLLRGIVHQNELLSVSGSNPCPTSTICSDNKDIVDTELAWSRAVLSSSSITTSPAWPTPKDAEYEEENRKYILSFICEKISLNKTNKTQSPPSSSASLAPCDGELNEGAIGDGEPCSCGFDKHMN